MEQSLGSSDNTNTPTIVDSSNMEESNMTENDASLAAQMSDVNLAAAEPPTENPANAEKVPLTQADAIRRQVEYYFSDTNLPTDFFLCKRMKGSKNKPVPLKEICKFKKMRGFQPYSAVVKALGSSKTLNVVQVNDEECVVRKVPFSRIKDDNYLESTVPKKKKRKPTGFEEYFTDVPITPAEFAEEQDLYDEDRNFAERIETAIQNYKSKRRMDPVRLNVYTKWMKFGGIETGPKQFSGGYDSKDYESHTAAEIARMKATEFVSDDKFDLGPDEKWRVDFSGVAAGFLSSRLPSLVDSGDPAELNKAVGVLRNFYNYIMHHNVCPEYKDDILKAKKICDTAEYELPKCRLTMSLFPGPFNIASSTLFGGYYKGLYAGDQSWNTDPEDDIEAQEQRKTYFGPGIGMKTGDARRIYNTAFTIPDGVYREETIVNTERRAGLEVTGIFLSTTDQPGVSGQNMPIGRLHCKPWTFPSLDDYDLPSEPSEESCIRPESYVFFIEDNVLDSCFVGMKIVADVHTASHGLVFFDNVLDVLPSFYQFLDNELLIGYKEPRVYTREELVEKDRAAAYVYDEEMPNGDVPHGNAPVDQLESEEVAGPAAEVVERE